MTIKERVLKFIEIEKLNPRQFELKAGLSNGSVSKMGENMRKSILDKISAAFPHLNRVWLLTGEGEMLNHPTGYKIDEIAIPTTEELQKLSNKEVHWIPLIPSAALANSLVEYTSNSVFLKDCPKTISPVLGAQYAISISGDSMEPEYHDGAIAYIKEINSSAFIPWGHTVILDTENGAFIKKIYPDSDDPEYVWARSINPAYPPMHIPVSSIYRLFRVLGTSRIFTTM